MLGRLSPVAPKSWDLECLSPWKPEPWSAWTLDKEVSERLNREAPDFWRAQVLQRQVLDSLCPGSLTLRRLYTWQGPRTFRKTSKHPLKTFPKPSENLPKIFRKPCETFQKPSEVIFCYNFLMRQTSEQRLRNRIPKMKLVYLETLQVWDVARWMTTSFRFLVLLVDLH